MKRGSALVMAIWIIAVLSIMALSFATEAHMQAGVNTYVRERNRVNRLTDAGQSLAEVVLIGFSEVSDYSEDEDMEDLLEHDRWIREKRALKSESKCSIGPILLDEEDVDSGTITVDISLVNAGAKEAININELFKDGDKNYRIRWELILRNYCGIPEDFEVEATDSHYKGGSKVPLMDLLICSWCDWRDEDDIASAGEDGDECGAESEWYEEYYEDIKADDEDRKFPRNGAIPNVDELGLIRGFRDFPVVLTGGVLNPEERDKKDQVTVRGIKDLFCVSGSAKLNVNDCTRDQLMTIPGIGNEEDEDLEDSMELADAILAVLHEEPEHRDDFEKGAGWYPYKDWDDLTQRLLDYDSGVEIGNEANEYLSYVPDQYSVFSVKITGESMGMTHEVNAECYVKDKKVRYIKWRED